jgi:hypothetical protein
VVQEEEDEVIGMIQILLEEPQIRVEEEAQLVLVVLPLLAVMVAQVLFFFGIHWLSHLLQQAARLQQAVHSKYIHLQRQATQTLFLQVPRPSQLKFSWWAVAAQAGLPMWAAVVAQVVPFLMHPSQLQQELTQLQWGRVESELPLELDMWVRLVQTPLFQA